MLVVIRQLVLLQVLPVITGTVLVVTKTAGTLAGTPCYNWDSAGCYKTAGTLAGTPCYNWDSAGCYKTAGTLAGTPCYNWDSWYSCWYSLL